MRADVYLCRFGWFESREKAQAAIYAGEVTIDGDVIEKPSKQIDESAEHDVKIGADICLYASRGGLKLEAAIKSFGLEEEIKGAVCVDIGASTGGFTDCLLSFGASRVWAVDCGSGQLIQRLRSDSRVRLLENFNARNLTPEDVGGMHPIITMDVSFISQTLIYPNIQRLLCRRGALISLIKPQFECGRAALDKHGVVKDEKLRSAAIERCRESARLYGLNLMQTIVSPIKGGDGNIEFPALFRKQ
ncbi:MAG: TlyA family RNA methyltransferase [Clostridiales bacterium]|mgnify:CR=1 FL=1|nr:TlyA family RNA methyltransferase [Clostridiales bacterium]